MSKIAALEHHSETSMLIETIKKIREMETTKSGDLKNQSPNQINHY